MDEGVLPNEMNMETQMQMDDNNIIQTEKCIGDEEIKINTQSHSSDRTIDKEEEEDNAVASAGDHRNNVSMKSLVGNSGGSGSSSRTNSDIENGIHKSTIVGNPNEIPCNAHDIPSHDFNSSAMTTAIDTVKAPGAVESGQQPQHEIVTQTQKEYIYDAFMQQNESNFQNEQIGGSSNDVNAQTMESLGEEVKTSANNTTHMTVVESDEIGENRVNEIASTLSTSGCSNSGGSGISSSTGGPIPMAAPIHVQTPNSHQQQQQYSQLPQQYSLPDPQTLHQPPHIFPNSTDHNNDFYNNQQTNQHQQQQQPSYNQLPTQHYSNENLQHSHVSSTTISPEYVDSNQHQQIMQQQQQQQQPRTYSSPSSSQSAPLQPQFTITHNPPPQQLQSSQPPPTSNINDISNSSDTNFDSILKSPKNKDDIVEKSPGERYLRFSEKLGSGAYKDVYRAYDTIEGIEVAWNAVTLTGVPKSQRQYIVNEVRLLEKLNHANIISFHGSWVNRELEQVIFVTEILSSGTLKSFIEKVQVIRWKIAKRWAKQILKGLEYLHSQDPPIVHRDLKCDNIFINGTSGDLRIGDFGLSTVINKGIEEKVLSVLGTPEFMAPELYNESYDQAVDIYAFGMCMLEIFTKEAPYRECSNPAQIYRKVTSGVEPQSLNRIRSSYARDFIRLCLGTPDGKGGYVRPSAKQLLNHPFLEKREDDDSEVKVDPVIGEVGIPEGASLTGTASPHSLQRAEHKSDSERSASQIFAHNMMNSDNHDPLNQAVHVMNGDIPDEFNGMPDRESNIKNVTVLMGRRQHNGENDNQGITMVSSQPSLQQHAVSQQQTQVPLGPQQTHMTASSQPIQQHSTQHQNQPPLVPPSHLSTSSQPIQQHTTQQQNSLSMTQQPHMTSGLSQESVGQVVRDVVDLTDYQSGMPYINDIMRLRTLFVHNQSNHVEFDFHLVKDDPVAVAHEMVSELHLPKEAVLELSEKISGSARNARMCQDHYKKQQLAQQDTQTQNLNLIHMEEVNTSFQVTAAKDPSSDMNNQLNPIDQYDNVAELNGGRMHNMNHENNQPIIDTNQQNHQSSQTNNLAATIAASSVPNHQEEKILGNNNNIGEMAIDMQQEIPIPLSIDTDDDSTNNLTEIKQLKIEFVNKVTRANKAYQTRMENLIRSKEEKEALHLKTVEKHEKERLAFEKRVKQAEKEQQERVQKLTKEFEQQKLKALQSKQLSPQDDTVVVAAEENDSMNVDVMEALPNHQRGGTNNNSTSLIEEGKLLSPSPTFSLDGKNKKI